jgi:hypothetical protein
MQQLALAAGPTYMIHALTPPDVYYTGEDPDFDWDRFIRSFDLRNEGIPMPPALEKQQFLRSLAGAAKQYLLDTPEIQTKSLAELKSHLAHEFRRKKRTTTTQLEDIVQQPQESVQKYYRRFMRIAQPALDSDPKLGISDAERESRRDARSIALSHVLCPIFIRNLRTDIRAQVIKEQCIEIETARVTAKKYEDYLSSFGRMFLPQSTVHCVDDTVNAVTSMDHVKTTLQNLSETSQRARSPGRPSSPYSGKKCYYCHNYGHIKRACKTLEYDRLHRSSQSRSDTNRDHQISRNDHRNRDRSFSRERNSSQNHRNSYPSRERPNNYRSDSRDRYSNTFRDSEKNPENRSSRSDNFDRYKSPIRNRDYRADSRDSRNSNRFRSDRSSSRSPSRYQHNKYVNQRDLSNDRSDRSRDVSPASKNE